MLEELIVLLCLFIAIGIVHVNGVYTTGIVVVFMIISFYWGMRFSVALLTRHFRNNLDKKE